jgi:hypothetical protein
MNIERSIYLAARKKDSRRDDLPVEYPLKDSQGLFVIKDRRREPDRQKAEYDYIDLNGILLKRGEAAMNSMNRLMLASPITIASVSLNTIGSISLNRLIFVSLIVATNAAVILMAYALILAIQN